MSRIRLWLIPAVLVFFGMTSIVTLNSVAQPFASQQLVYVVFSLGLFALISQLKLSVLYKHRWLLYFGLLGMLILTLIIGTITNGARRWISVGNLFSIQSSQFAVAVVSLSVTSLLAKSKNISFKELVQLLIIILSPAALIMAAPDLGSTIVYLLSVGVALWLGPIDIRWLLSLLGLGMVAAAIGWFFIFKDFQKDRIICFIAPETNASCSQYNAEQSLIAVGSGSLFGRGVGQGIQSHLQFLPERQTDFIFASFAEEWGFFGSIILIVVYMTLISHIVFTGLEVNDKSVQLLCFIVAAAIAIQSSVHIGMNMYLFPITGISLPFVSYGGSSLIGMTVLVSLVQMAAQTVQKKQRSHFS